MTATCGPHSKRNHTGSVDGEVQSLGDMHRSLDYVRNRMPDVVLLENVATPWAVHGINSMLGEIAGYQWRTMRADPSDEPLRVPMSRDRQYWVGVRE